MNKEKIASQLIDYREGNLTDSQANMVAKKLEKEKEWQVVQEELEALDQLMENAPTIKPSANSRQRFEQLLAKEQRTSPLTITTTIPKERTFSLRQVLQVAAAITLLLLGTGIGLQWKNNQVQQQELAALQAEMALQKKLLALSLLEQNSASDRIKGINVSLKETNRDSEIIHALIQRMNIDANVNVRLKAIEGLAQFGNQSLVTAAFIKALNEQKTPEVQIAIMEVLVELQIKDAYPSFQKIAKDEEVIEAVRNEAADGLSTLL